MNVEENVRIKLLSGLNVDLSEKVYTGCYLEFDEIKYYSFSNKINSGQYFPQIMQFIFVMIGIFNGHTSFKDIFLCNLLTGVFYTITWFLLKSYKIPGIDFISCLIGGTIFRYFLHFVVIAIVSLAVIDNWKIIIYCLIGGFFTSIVTSILFVRFSTVKYNDEVAIYVSKFKTSL